MIIRDNALSLESFNVIKEDIIYNKALPWYWNDHKVRPDDGTNTLVHLVYKDMKSLSDFFVKIHTYFSVPLNIIAWYRIKINLTWKERESKVFGFHRDYGSLEDPEKFKAMKTAIYYCTDTNGPTVFQDSDDKIDCVENRLALFDSHKFHSGVSHTEGNDRRIVINFNYF
tara:strand:- start:632 stop:1141 length:510 start_codon:yes stop_codon:yes gene_type:complete